jgi:hypothetical protein
MSIDFSWFKSFLPWLDGEDETRSLALQIEEKVKKLSDLPSARVDSTSQDILAILKSTCLLLDRLVERHERSQNQLATEIVPETAGSSGEVSLVDAESETSTKIPTKIELEPEPNATAKELIKLRDWVLLAKSNDSPADSQVFESLYRKLGQILAKEGLISLEADGRFNYEQQQVLDTQTTDNPKLDEFVCTTVRPGYLFNERLVRPQEVIVYSFDSASN